MQSDAPETGDVGDLTQGLQENYGKIGAAIPKGGEDSGKLGAAIPRGEEASDFAGASGSATAEAPAEEEKGLFDRVKDLVKPEALLNPVAAATEALGTGTEWVGEKINDGADFLDENSQNLPGFLKPAAGQVSGTLGFTGDLVEGVGGATDYVGRLAKGDPQTIQSTLDTAQSIGEAGAYIQGRQLETLGGLVGSEGLQQLGQGAQGLASEETRKVLDASAEAVTHYAGQGCEWGGQALERVGQATGSEGLQNGGRAVADIGAQVQEQTRNPITDAVDQAVNGRMDEYRENGAYAVPRDLTRVALEIGTAVVAPESLPSKLGPVTRAAEASGDIKRGLDAADAAGDVGRIPDAGVDAGRLGWEEAYRQGSLGLDPANNRFRPNEMETALTLEGQGITLERYHPEMDANGRPTSKGDWIDPTTNTVYDAVSPAPAEHLSNKQWRNWEQSLHKHLDSDSVDKVVVDLTDRGYSEDQVNRVRDYLGSLSPEEQARVVTIGF